MSSWRDGNTFNKAAGDLPPASQKNNMWTKAKNLWQKTGITIPVYESMFKGALTPTIVLCAFQSTAWANQYSTIGYLVGIVSVLSVVIQPRAKFVQTMLVQITLSCLGCALALLGCYCAVHARINSEKRNGTGSGEPGTSGLASQGAPTTTYNSSASAVAGVWLFAEIYLISVVRARLPQYNIPCVMWAIMANISMTYAPQFGTMAQAEVFCIHLLTAYLTGFAIASCVSLLIFPSTSRKLLFTDMDNFISGLRSALGANMTYLNSLEDIDMFAAQRTNTAGEKPRRSPEAEAFVAEIRALGATEAKFAANLPFAQREVAIGKLGADDLQQIVNMLRDIMIPAVGLSSMSNIFDRTSEERGWDRSKSFVAATVDDVVKETDKARIQSMNEWHKLIGLLKEPFGSISDVIDEGLQHVAITLRISKTWKRAFPEDDREAAKPKPGSKAFAAYLQRRAEEFQKSKQIMLRGWCSVHDMELPDDFFSNPFAPDVGIPSWMNARDPVEARSRMRRQLMVMLYVEFLLYSMGRRTHELVKFVDALRDSGKLTTTRLVVPGYKRLRKWIISTMYEQDDDDDYSPASTVYLGQAYKKKKDPEHLPPQNMWERFSNKFRKLAHFSASPASAFGVRVACATMSIAVLNLLRDTQVLFTTERLFWAQIMTSIAMSPSAGQSLRTFILRVSGTFIALPLSLVAWYIVDGKTAGILVFYFIFLHVGMYLLIKYPNRAQIGVISQVTLTLIIGYELQARQLGLKGVQSNGQKYYPVYELGPIRLATVCAGLLVAWIFTIFPYPITEHSQLRKNLGSALYLVANYHSVVTETVKVRLRGAEGDSSIEGSPGQRLTKIRSKLHSKCNVLLSGLRAQCSFVKFDIPVGGKFPMAQYQEIVERLNDILSFLSLVSLASTTFTNLANIEDETAQYEWVRKLRRVVNEANLTSHTVTTLLSLLSASVSRGQALPPYLRTPEPYTMSKKLERLDNDILSVRHIAQPGYASYAVIQIGNQCMIEDLKELLAGVKELVGELDFSFHIVSTSDLPSKDSEETLTYTPTRPGDDDRHKRD